MTTGPDPGGCAVFDVDGTLLNRNYLHVAARWEAFRERSLDIAAVYPDAAAMVADLAGSPLARCGTGQ